MLSNKINIARIKAVNNILKDLQEEFVFVGGATVSLYVDRQVVEDARPTDDVDVLVELLSHNDYAALEEKLRKIGFTNDINAKFVGRYLINGITVDLMPTNENILGFSNRWYEEGFKTAVDITLDEFHKIKIFEVTYFIGAKLEAFKKRGKQDGRTSSDFEDIIFVLNNRDSVWEELSGSDEAIKKYLKKEFGGYLTNDSFEEWINSHLGFYSSESTRYIIQKLKEFVEG